MATFPTIKSVVGPQPRLISKPITSIEKVGSGLQTRRHNRRGFPRIFPEMFTYIRYPFLLHSLATAAWAQNGTILDKALQNRSIPTTQRIGFVWGTNNRSTLMLL